MQRLKRIIIVIGNVFGLLIGLVKINKQGEDYEYSSSGDRYDQEVGDDCGGDLCGCDECRSCNPILPKQNATERENNARREVKNERQSYRFAKLHGGNKRDRSRKG